MFKVSSFFLSFFSLGEKCWIIVSIKCGHYPGGKSRVEKKMCNAPTIWRYFKIVCEHLCWKPTNHTLKFWMWWCIPVSTPEEDGKFEAFLSYSMKICQKEKSKKSKEFRASSTHRAFCLYMGPTSIEFARVPQYRLGETLKSRTGT